MTVQLELTPEIEAKVRQHAARSGQDVENFVLQAVAEKLADAEPGFPIRDGMDWKEKLRTCIDLHPVVTRFVDDSRESIYAGRGE